MRRPALLCALALTFVGVHSAAHAVTVTGPSTVRLANTVVPNLAKASLVGHVPAAQRIQVTVSLAHPNEAGELALQKALYDKSSPAYHRFLTPAQYAARFGVGNADFDRVTGWLTRDGMTVRYATPSRTQVLVEGTAAQAEQTFDVTLNDYAVNGHGFRANPSPALVPAGVNAVLGLQTASAYVLPQRTAAPPDNDICIQGKCIGGYSPQGLWKAYHLPSTDKGRGVRAAVIGEGDTANTIAGLRQFESITGLPQVPTRSVFVANDKSDTSGDGEWQIDSQAITGMAPDLEQLVFYMSQDLVSVSNSISAWVNDTNGPSIANMSIGGCETLNLALGTPLVEQPLLRQGALEGRTLFVSTGDTGGSCLLSPLVNLNGVENTGVPNPQWPSSSDAVVGVGGTVLYTGSNGERLLEYTWTHGGGGTSSFIPAPDWQKPITLIKAPCSTDYTLAPVSGYTPCRGVPDVSALSGDILSNGYGVYDQTGTWFPGAGTSLSSPLWAGIWARAQATSSTPLGLATPVLYGLANAGTLDGFTDISVGSNVQWTAQPRTPVNTTGWDFTNGLGAPVGDNLITDITGSTTPVKATNDTLPLDTSETATVAGSDPCVSAGTYADPAGDAVPFPADVDLTGSTIQVVGSNLVFTSTVSNLQATPGAKEFDWDFTSGSSSFEVEGVLGAGQVMTTARLVDSGFNDIGGSPTVSASGNTVTVTISLASFDAATGLAPGATLGSIITNGDMIAGPGATPLDLAFIIDQLDATACAGVTA